VNKVTISKQPFDFLSQYAVRFGRPAKLASFILRATEYEGRSAQAQSAVLPGKAKSGETRLISNPATEKAISPKKENSWKAQGKGGETVKKRKEKEIIKDN